MRVISVNIGSRQAIKGAKSSGVTGIYKMPTDQPVQISTHGLRGDFIGDTKHHGGPDQAVYIYGKDGYDWWSQQLGETLEPGTFGENLTIDNLHSAEFNVGDRLIFDEVILEVTSPRMPCPTLLVRMSDEQFGNRFIEAERPGLYCRVIREGLICRDEIGRREPYTGEKVTILEMFRTWYEPELDEATIRRYLNAPISSRARKEKEKQLSELK